MRKICLLTCIVLLTGYGIASADIYYVNTYTGDDNFPGTLAEPKRTIQAAIDICPNGDTVMIADGIYSGLGNHTIDYDGKAITVQSENGPINCIIDCQAGPANPLRAFSFENGETYDSVIDGVTIINGYGWGGAIFCLNSSPTISNCIIRQNTSAGKGGGIACNNADPNIIGCTIINNSAVDGGGVYCFNSRPTFINCTINNNQTTGSSLNGLGGGLCNENNSLVTLSQCRINGNRARFGAAIFSRDSSLNLMNCLISGNLADSHGGAAYSENSSFNITNCTVGDNYAEVYGGAFRAFNNSTINLANSVLWSDSVANIDQRGSEIALGSNSSVNIAYCDVRGGPDLILREVDSTLNWDQTNIGENEADDPLYALSGYWDPNASPLDTEDDFWVEGDYRLLPQSPGIDRGSNAALIAQNSDLDNGLRIINSLIDLGAYETGLNLAKMKINAGKNRLVQPNPADSFTLSGTFDAVPQNFLDNTEMQIYLGPYTETIALELPLFTQVGDSPRFIYKRSIAKDEPGAITAMKFDLTKGTFSLVAKGIDLTGLETPADVIINIGDDYYRAAVVGEMIANAKKPVPIQFLMGQKDSLRIYQLPKFKLATAKQGPGNDSLQIQGGISLANLPPNLAGKRVDIQWGDYSDYIPADGWIADSSGNKFIYKKNSSDPTPNRVALAQFDFSKCTFKIIIKNADIGPLYPPQNLTISFEGFEATVRPPYFR